jgi:5-methylcytosine-specific restriction endonuclease McrA
MSKAWSGGSTRAWRKTRARVLARDGEVCQLRLDCCTWRATEVHHLDGKAEGDDDTSRLVAVCHACHEAVTAAEQRGDPEPDVWRP